MNLFELDELVVLAELFEVVHRLGVVEAVVVVDLAISRQLTELIIIITIIIIIIHIFL